MENTALVSNCPREEALRMMERSISPEEREKNTSFVESLKAILVKHPLNKHPVLETLNTGDLSFTDLQEIHLEYREAIVKIFTDALTIAVFNTKQLEPRLSAGSKMAARSLLTLNCLDEFGFKVGVSHKDYYVGTPEDAHYPLFEKVLKDLQLKEESIKGYQPSDSATQLKDYLESSYHSYSLILALLAVAEAQVITFSPALRKAVKSFDIDVSKGYYHVHGVSSDAECSAADDDHEDDMWAALIQSVVPEEYDFLTKEVEKYLELWNEFWTQRGNTIERNRENIA